MAKYNRGKRLLAAGEQGYVLDGLSGRLDVDFNAGFEHVFRVGNDNFRTAAAEKLGKDALETCPDLFHCFGKHALHVRL